jgi:hypothetical protein
MKPPEKKYNDFFYFPALFISIIFRLVSFNAVKIFVTTQEQLISNDNG